MIESGAITKQLKSYLHEKSQEIFEEELQKAIMATRERMASEFGSIVVKMMDRIQVRQTELSVTIVYDPK